jgi:hypothetical protein
MARNQPGTDTSDYVFFPGCQLSASSPDHVEKAYCYLIDQLLDKNVGLMLGCCGAPANWAGRNDLFDTTLSQWRSQLQTMGNPVLILACSSCYQVFKSYMPEIKIISLWDIFDQYGLPEVRSMPTNQTVSIHDPCATRHENHIHDSVRRIVHQMGYQIEELPLSRERTACCSYGGHMWLANHDLAQNVVQRRIAEGEADYVTYCAMCRDFFAAQGKRTLHILDMIYDQDVEACALRRGPGYSQRHENRARLKRKLLKEVWSEPMDEKKSHYSIQLLIDDDVQERLEQRLILVEDIQQVIEYAEQTGRKLLNRTNGHFLAYFKPNSVTYWVEYLPQDDAYIIFNAYSHRMEVPGSTSI